MSVKIEIKNLDALKAFLQGKGDQFSSAGVEIGYTANYATYVHENLGANFKVGQAKFLESAAKEVIPTVRSEVSKNVTNGNKTFLQMLMIIGLRIQRLALLRTPVDTGNLRASSYVRPIGGELGPQRKGRRARKGGERIGGKFFKGGQFIPASALG